MRTHALRSKKLTSPLLPPRKEVTKSHSVGVPPVQAKSKEEGLAEWEAQRQKWERIGSPWMDKVPNPSGELAQPWIQRKLTLGKPNDKYEQEADRVASQVVQQIKAPVAAQPFPQSEVQRQTELDKFYQAKRGTIGPRIVSLPPGLQRKGMPNEEDLQTKSTDPQRRVIPEGEALTNLESAINKVMGRGQPLDMGVQQAMGQAMGADFSGVRVHTDAQSNQLNQSLQAKAFTTGQDVFFRQGAYAPENRSGQELIAHELTHVVQQNGDMGQRSTQPKQTLYPLDSREGREGQNVEARLGLQKNNFDESVLQAKWSGDIPAIIGDKDMRLKLIEMNPEAATIPVWRITMLRNSEEVYDTYQKVLEHFGLTGSKQQETLVEAPTKKVEASTKKAEAPTKKTEAPTKKAEAPTKKVEAPTKKAEAPTKKAEALAEEVDSPAFKFLIPENLELRNLIRGDSRDHTVIKKEGFKPGKTVEGYFDKLIVFLDNLTEKNKSELVSAHMKNRVKGQAILNPEAKRHKQIDLVWSLESIEVKGGKKITLLNYVCTGMDSGAGGNNYLIKVDETFKCIAASPSLGLYESKSGLQILAMASSASAGPEGKFVKFHEYDFLTPIPADKIYYSSKDGGTKQVVTGGEWFNVVTKDPL